MKNCSLPQRGFEDFGIDTDSFRVVRTDQLNKEMGNPLLGQSPGPAALEDVREDSTIWPACKAG